MAFRARRSLVHVEANFTVQNAKTESGEYKTVIMAKHGQFALSLMRCRRAW